MSVKRGAAKQLYDFNRVVHSPHSPMHEVIELGRRAADYDISVLITGGAGTGKELLARAIHYGPARANKAFVVENCGALPDELLESELFGCKKGAAYQDRIGLFEMADGGTIFLDEIGETSPAFQVKLLRVLQESEIRPLGAQRVRKVSMCAWWPRPIAISKPNHNVDTCRSSTAGFSPPAPCRVASTRSRRCAMRASRSGAAACSAWASASKTAS
ncbi:hypothetical protein ACVWXO_001050 [Bradyrhizobium sp. LM2.7]